MNPTRRIATSRVWKFTAQWLPVLGSFALAASAAEFYVSPQGSDANPGTKEKPLATIGHARDVVRTLPERGKKPVSVILRGGVYYLPETLIFTPEDSGRRPGAMVEYRSADGEETVISGGFELKDLKWEPYTNGIFKTHIAIPHQPSPISFDQLFVNGERLPMARYPNFDAGQRVFNGYAADAISDARAAKWADPAGGFIHMMHGASWGGYHYVITGKDAAGKLKYEGGWQNNRGGPIHKEHRFVENIFEELDAPGEWFFNAKTSTLYFFPPAGLDPAKAKFEGVRLRSLVEFRGTESLPVKFLNLRGLTFRHAARTFMDNKEPMLRTDWTVYRGGAIFFEGAEDCAVADCVVDQVGGNAIFANNYNRRLAVRGCDISKAGGNGVAFVGDPAAVRDGLVGYGSRMDFSAVDKTPGPKTQNYPADCIVEDCLIRETGRVEKQTAGVEIDMAMNITVRHCSIYDMPRAGVNIGDGCWGGHVVEFCDVFDTVLETGDHGSFNSWGRDRFWGLKGIDLNTVTLGENRNLPLLDVIATNILRNNRWRCDHGWDIDLDDGSSNYEIRNNLCLGGGLKNREGFYRVVENNITVNNSFHPHVWYGNSADVFSRNIVFTPYRPIGMKAPWGREIDFNLLHRAEPPKGGTPSAGASSLGVPASAGLPAAELQKDSGRDEHSLIGDALFVDPASGDYRVKEGSPALKLGFVNFPMNQFGVKSPRLKKLARTPVLPVPGAAAREESKRDARVVTWLGAKIKNVIGLGEISASGLPGEVGARLLEVPDGCAAAKAGLRVGDVILKCNGKATDSAADLLRVWRAQGGAAFLPPGDDKHVAAPCKLEVWRDQKAIEVEVTKERGGLKGVSVKVESRDDKVSVSAGDLAHGIVPTASRGTANEPLATLTDGKLAANYGPVFPNGRQDGKYRLDLGAAKSIAAVNTFSHAQGPRGRQVFQLYGSASATDPGFDVGDAAKFTLIADVDTGDAAKSRFTATSVRGPIGSFRWLVWAVEPVNEHPGENTAFQEFDVVAAP